jgi:DNA-binding MarR family transcriptional regulator
MPTAERERERDQKGAGEGSHEERLERAVRQMLVVRRVIGLALKQISEQAPPEMVKAREGQYHVLHALAKEGRLMVGELADRCHVADPTISKMLKTLEQNGVVERHTDPENRRVVWVSLTPLGREAYDKMVTYFEGGLARVLQPLTDEQLEDLIVAFGHLERLVGQTEATC